jgi:hypothetical protein
LACGQQHVSTLLIDVSWDAATYGAAEIEPGLASYAFNVGNLGFANAWMAMGTVQLIRGRTRPRR